MAEAAQLLGVVPRTISKYREQGKVRGIREGKTWAIWVPRALITLAHADHSGTHSGSDPERSGTGMAVANPTLAEPVEATYRVSEDALVTEAARQQLTSIRDEWLQPLVDRIATLEREGGWLEAERDTTRKAVAEQRRRAEIAEAERDALRRRLDAAQAAPQAPGAAEGPPPAVVRRARARRAARPPGSRAGRASGPGSAASHGRGPAAWRRLLRALRGA